MANGLLPSSTVLDGWMTMDEALRWAGIDQGLASAFFRQLGDPALDSLPVLAMIPSEVIQSSFQRAVRGTRQLNSIEVAQLTLLVNAVKAKFGQQGLAAETTTRAVAAVPPAVSTSASPKLKLKLNQIVDQGCDLEVEQLPHTQLVELRRRYVVVEGDAPTEKEEVTDAQLTCLWAKIEHGMSPFVDMGVWGAYGDRLARAMKFTSQQRKDGQWKSIEIPGASSLLAWEEAWRIFRTAALMLNLATAATLDRYSASFKARVHEYPNVWHLAAQADIRCRSEFWIQELRRQEAFFSAHPELSSFSPRQPWNNVIKVSATHLDFWAKEFEKPALLYQMNGARAMPAAYPPPRQTRCRQTSWRWEPEEETLRSTEKRWPLYEVPQWHQHLLWLGKEQRWMWKHSVPQTHGTRVWVVSPAPSVSGLPASSRMEAWR